MIFAYDEDENDDSQGLTQYLDQNREWKQFQCFATREMQLTLKMVMNKVEVQNFDQRLDLYYNNNTNKHCLTHLMDFYLGDLGS